MPLQPSTLSQLVDVLKSAVNDLESVYAVQGIPLPSLDQTTPLNEQDQRSDKILIEDPKGSVASNTIVGVCTMLNNIVQAPVDLVRWHACSYMYSSSIQIVIKANVPEILREKEGSKGVHIDDIANISGADANKLGRVLRFLVTNHVFQEVAPDVFANNRVSLALDTGMSLEEIKQRGDRLSGTGQTSAWCEFYSDNGLKIAHLLPDVIAHPTEKHHGSPLTMYNQSDEHFFEWITKPENHKESLRFNFAMGSQNRGASLLDGFNWTTLPKKGQVVDVGGGTGFAMLPLVNEYPDFKIIIQDLPEVIEKAKSHWTETLPKPVDAGIVSFQAHDFFKPQPVQGADVYFLRSILHDWNQSQAIEILKQIAKSAHKKSRLIVMDSIVDYACPASALPDLGIPGATAPSAPAPLPNNFGVGGLYPYRADMFMMQHFSGAEERSGYTMNTIFREAGWNLIRIHRGQLTQYIGELL